jgi:hypothetical protein
MQEQIKVDGVLYRQQYRKCGKPDCKCTEGELHGPYWYSYDGNSAAKYVGKQLPAHVTDRAKLLKTSAARFKRLKQDLTKKREEHYREYSLAGRQLQAVQSLEAGERVDSSMLVQLGLSQFNGHEKGGA